jgi:hypothetical protein
MFGAIFGLAFCTIIPVFIEHLGSQLLKPSLVILLIQSIREVVDVGMR